MDVLVSPGITLQRATDVHPAAVAARSHADAHKNTIETTINSVLCGNCYFTKKTYSINYVHELGVSVIDKTLHLVI